MVNPFAEIQKQGLVLNLKFGDHEATGHCYFPLALWLGDIKSQDMLAGRTMTHRRGCPRLNWQCNCSYEEIDDETAVCEPFNAAEYREMVSGCEAITVYDEDNNRFFGGASTEEERGEFLERRGEEGSGMSEEDDTPTKPESIMDLDRFGRYVEHLKSRGCVRVDSVLNRLDYGGCPGGQFSALSIDLLHSLPGGLVKQVVGCFVRGLPSAMKELFEEVADRIFLGQRSCENKYLPRMNFTHGCTNMTEMTCREWVGLMMCILVVCNSYSGSAILAKLVKKTNREIAKAQSSKAQNSNSASSSARTSRAGALPSAGGPPVVPDDESDDGDTDLAVDANEADPVEADVDGPDFIETSETVLAFYGYMHQSTFWEKGDTGSKQYFKESCDILIRMLKRKCPRTVGNGWKLSKLHAMLKRSPDSIERNGCLLYTSPSPRDLSTSRMPSSA